MRHFDREIYFDAVKASQLFTSLTQEQVDGQNVILAVGEFQLNSGAIPDLRWLGYMLATTYHETATRMWPIEEYGHGDGHDYGDEDPETGQTYYGRGFVQLTWRENYARASKELKLEEDRNIEWNAAKALDCLIATRVMFKGMSEGWFTGKALGDYFNDAKDDPVNARQIINGNDRDEEIAGYHDTFMQALEDATVTDDMPTKASLVVRITIDAPPGVVVEVVED